VHGMEQMTLDIGKDFEIVTVSFNPHETWQLAGAKKNNYMEKFSKPGVPAAWHFLTGQEPAIKSLADAAGFRYYYDRRTKQFAHASGIMVLTPEGKVALSIRDRIQAARSAAGSGGGIQEPDRRAHRQDSAVLFPLRSDDR